MRPLSLHLDQLLQAVSYRMVSCLTMRPQSHTSPTHDGLLQQQQKLLCWLCFCRVCISFQ